MGARWAQGFAALSAGLVFIRCMFSLACHQNTEVDENQFVNFSRVGGQLREGSRGKNPRLKTRIVGLCHGLIILRGGKHVYFKSWPSLLLQEVLFTVLNLINNTLSPVGWSVCSAPGGGLDRFDFTLMMSHPAAESSTPEDLGLLFPECNLSLVAIVLGFNSFKDCKQIIVLGP